MPLNPTSLRPILLLSFHLCQILQVVSLPQVSPTKTLYASLLSQIHAVCPAHLILDLITRIIFGEEYRAYGCSLCSLLHSPITSSLLGKIVFFNALFLNTLSLYSSLSVRDQVSHPYKTTGSITVLCIL